MAAFNSRPVTIIRHPGTPEEYRWDARMGGDFDAKALFQASDKVIPGDEIHCDLFDVPRIVLRVKAVLGSGEISHWKVMMAPQPEWNRRLQVKRLPELARDQMEAPAPPQGDPALTDGDDRTFDFVSETGRISAIAAYIRHWTTDVWDCSEASLARTAKVHPADLSKWKKAMLPPGSDKKKRIEAALENNEHPTPPAERQAEA
jgi:hypothetical protein